MIFVSLHTKFSVAGHRVPIMPLGGEMNIYPATKYAVTALSEICRIELSKTKIRTSVSILYILIKIKIKYA